MTTEEPAFKIKTGNLPVLKLHLLTTDMHELQEQLAARLEKTPDFFSNTPILLELSAIAGSDAAPDFSGLTSFMLKHRMCAAGVAGGSQAQQEAAASAGLALFASSPSKVPEPPAMEPSAAKQAELPGFGQEEKSPVEVVETVSVRPTLFIDKPVRTGQRIYAEGASLVVLGVVNAGAELIADGDIHVYAPMRGRAIAGAQGNESARIFVQGMEAELLSIAGCFKVFEDAMPERGKPAQVRLDGSRLLIEPMSK
jgi:septum site-determining protein MinC